MRHWILTALLLLPPGVAADVQSLEWLSGSWRGEVGPAVLEEHWSKPEGGSMVAAVRMTGGGKTSMIEIISISDAEDGLAFNLQQFSKTLQPKTAVQTMVATEQTATSIAFRAPDQEKTEGLLGVAYSLTGDGALQIDVDLAEGRRFTAVLSRP